MYCIIKQTDGIGPDSIEGWIIGTDLDDLRRRAQANGEMSLAAELYSLYEVPPGKHILNSGFILLVD